MDIVSTGKVITQLGETGGAVGLVCGVLLVVVLFFLRHLMQNLQSRDKELIRLNQELQKALVNNTAAMTTLAHILKNRRCLANDSHIIQQIDQATNPRHFHDR